MSALKKQGPPQTLAKAAPPRRCGPILSTESKDLASILQENWDKVCRRILDRNIVELAVVLTACRIEPQDAQTVQLSIPPEQQEWFADGHEYRALLETICARVIGQRIGFKVRADMTLGSHQSSSADPRRQAYQRAERRQTVRLLEALFDADVVARELFASDDFAHLAGDSDRPDDNES